MVLVNTFIAFFVIVALGVSWLAYNFVFGTASQIAGAVGSNLVDRGTGKAAVVLAEAVEAVSVSLGQTPVSEPGPIQLPKQPSKQPSRRKGITCRDQIVAAARALTEEKGENEFAAKEVVEFVIKKGTDYSIGTIRSSVSSQADFERIERGRYRLAVEQLRRSREDRRSGEARRIEFIGITSDIPWKGASGLDRRLTRDPLARGRRGGQDRRAA